MRSEDTHRRHRGYGSGTVRAAGLALGALVALTIVATPASTAPAPAVAAAVVPGDDWQVDTPESHGMAPADLDAARDYAFADGKNTQGVVVVHEGAIVSEWYDEGKGPDVWAGSWSVAKSFTSALIGIALERGLIPSIDEPMTTYYPEWIGTAKESITLRHVLHMESGLDWDENYDPASIGESEIIAMVAASTDQLTYAADRPAEVAPGTRFNYSSGDTMLLSGVLEQATGMSTFEFGQDVLFDRIGIDPVDWWQDAEGHTLTYCCLDMPTRDFARFGLLYLLDGNWDGEQVVPSSWVDTSVTDTASTYGGYGYQWWLDSGGGGIPPYYSARGHDGQYIYVIPDLDLVVVRNGTYTKSACPSIADPNLIIYYPSDNLIPGQGTVPPDSWSDDEFLAPIVSSITGDPVDLAAAGGAGDPALGTGAAADSAGDVVGAPDCPNVAQPVAETTTTTSAGPSTTTSIPARPSSSTPRFTG